MATTTEPYGDVAYADPGWQPDGKKCYPIDTEVHALRGARLLQQASQPGALHTRSGRDDHAPDQGGVPAVRHRRLR